MQPMEMEMDEMKKQDEMAHVAPLSRWDGYVSVVLLWQMKREEGKVP